MNEKPDLVVDSMDFAKVAHAIAMAITKHIFKSPESATYKEWDQLSEREKRSLLKLVSMCVDPEDDHYMDTFGQLNSEMTISEETIFTSVKFSLKSIKAILQNHASSKTERVNVDAQAESIEEAHAKMRADRYPHEQ